jgi:hypothetical protein
MQPGIYRGLPNADYHGGPGISKSGLDLIRKSPAHYRAIVTADNDNERKPTPAQAIGTALHMLVLEPAEFARTYTLALQRQDVPDAIDDRDQLATMVQELNASRKAKLPTSGSKADLIARITSALYERGAAVDDQQMDQAKASELKSIIEAENATRAGLLPVSGTRHELAEILRANGKPVTLWSDVQAEWMANNGHRQVLTAEQFEQLRNMRDAVMAHPAASRLLAAPGEAELSAYWMQKVYDMDGDLIGEQLCRVRPDKLRKDGIVIDLKTTEDASEEEFARSIAKFAYHVQDDFYRRGLTEAMRQCGGFEDFQLPRAFVFIAIEKTACVVDGEAKGVAVYSLDEDSRALGMQQWRADLQRYTECQNSGKWPGYRHGICQIKLPAWQFKRAAEAASN